MLKNKIYNYFVTETLKTFLTILFAFTAIAWTVRAVNFLDLVVDNGHSIKTYLLFSFFNVTNIITKFIPLSFLLALSLSIQKFERQSELVILWTSGLNKIKIVNLFFVFSLLILIIQLCFATFITPNSLNKSRSLIKMSNFSSIGSIMKINAFSDSFDDITFYIEKLSGKNIMKNIFIRDESNTFNNLTNSTSSSVNTTITAENGFIQDGKLMLFEGQIQTQDKNDNLKNIFFEKTELLINPLTPRTITKPKLQETFTSSLLICAMENQIDAKKKELLNCPKNNLKKDIIETLSRRIGMPLYIPLVSLICCFLLISTKENKYKKFKKYAYFTLGFLILILAEILVRYSGFSKLNTIIYFFIPIILIPFTYLILIKKFAYEKINQ
jgi:lipopolysaccharide export system permease protein|tara:strand:- start:396 stop:1547 length:1152 start_codon:yes stop_codon:yes gene_type:complete